MSWIGTVIGFLILFGYPLYIAVTSFGIVPVMVVCLLIGIFEELRKILDELKKQRRVG